MNSLLAIRCDGGTIHCLRGKEDIASGHLMRMLNIAARWRKQNRDVLLIVNQNCEGIGPFLERYRELGCLIEKTEVPFCDSLEDAERTASIVTRIGGRHLYLDGYHFTSQYQEVLYRHGLQITMQDDTGTQGPYWAETIVGGHIHAPNLKYNAQPSTQFFLGPKYALLNESFLEQRKLRSTPVIAKKLLVTMGSSDPFNDTEKCLRGLGRLEPIPAIDAWLRELKITVVIGATNPRRRTIETTSMELMQSRGCQVEILENVRNMAALISETDLAFSATGGTILELLCLGTPVAVQIIHPIQVPIANTLVNLGVCHIVGDSRNLSHPAITEMEDRVASDLFKLAYDAPLREAFSSRGQDLVDGKGVDRVCDVLTTRILGSA